jgi:hypothetical protein
MADEVFDGMALAIDEQSTFGTINATIRDLGNGGSTDGYVLGDRNSGDAESGITFPTISPIVREVVAVGGSFTESADAFIRTLVEGLAITFPMQGNGATATPAAGEAKPFLGLDAIWESLGLTGANGTSPVYEYTPRTSQSVTYSTIKLFVGDLSFALQDCVPESASIEFTPGGNGLCTVNFKVGELDTFADTVTFPTIDYTTQKSLAAPTIEGVDFTWGTGHPGSPDSGFETLTIDIANTVEEYGDSNVDTTGLRYAQTRRVISVSGRLYVIAADSDYAYQNVISATAPTDDLSFQVGTAAGAAATINAYKVEVNNLQGKGIEYDRTGQVLSVELTDSKATSTTAGTEFKLTFN